MKCTPKYAIILMMAIILPLLCSGKANSVPMDLDHARGVDTPPVQAKTVQEKEAEQNVRALNHFNMSLYKIAHYNNKAVLDEEYDTINNDIKLDSIGDKKLVSIIQELMDALTSCKISEMERAKMHAAYQDMQEELILNILRDGGSAVGRGLIEGAMTSSQGFLVGGLAGAAAGLIASTPSIASSVAKDCNKLALQQQKIEDFEWKLDIAKLNALNKLNKKFLSTYWEFLHDANVPDNLRISEKQITSLLEVNREKEPEIRYRMLARLEKECGNIPSYWYYRADAAHDILVKEENADDPQHARLVSDIQECLEQYKELAGMLRKDNTLASLLMLHLSSAPLAPEEAKEKLDQIVEVFPLDASKRLFAALICLHYGLNDDAVEHLNANLDMRQYEVISRKLLADIYQNRHEEQKAITLLQKLLRDDSTSNQEILYHLGKLSQAGEFMRNLEPQLAAISIEIKPSLVGDDDIEIIMPMKWEILEDTSVPTIIKIDGRELASNDIDVTKDKKIIITFKKVVKSADLVQKLAVPVNAEIQTRHFPIILQGTIRFSENAERQDQGISSKIRNTTKKLMSRFNGRFDLQKIQCGEFFQREDGKWVQHSL